MLRADCYCPGVFAMWDRLLELLPLGCRHRRTSLPFSSPRKTNADSQWESITQEKSGPYVVCLDCGKHFDYDWNAMRVVK